MEYIGPECNRIKERPIGLDELEARLLESKMAHQADQATIVNLTQSNKNLAKKMAFLYTDMAELKSRLDRFDAFHVGLNTQLDTVMAKLERLEAPVLTQSVIDRVGYLQLRFKAWVGDLF